MSEPQLLRELASDDPELRRRAVIEIGTRSQRGHTSALLLALGDPEWRVRKEAVRVAREQAVAFDLLPSLVNAICQGENVGLRNAALDVLEVLGTDAANALMNALPSVSPDAKKFVIEALACGGDPKVASTLAETSRGADVMTAVTAIEALSVVGGPVAESTLRSHLASQEALIRMASLDGLNRLGAVLSWDELSPLLADRMVRRVAIAALGRCERVEAVAPLVVALTDRSLHLARAAVISLARLQTAEASVAHAVEAELRALSANARTRLRDLAADVEITVREAAVQTLVGARDEDGLGEVIDLAASGMLTPSAHESLQRWGRPLAALLLQRYRELRDRSRPTVLELAADAALECVAGNTTVDLHVATEVRDVLRDALHHSDPTLVLAAARCMGEWAQPNDAALLVTLAGRDGDDIGHAAGRALSMLAARAPEAVHKALDAKSLDSTITAPLTTLIAGLGGPLAVTRLQTALSSQDPSTRKAALEGLASLPDPKVGELIAFALADESVEVQMTAARVLGGLRDAQGQPLGIEPLLLALGSESDGVQASAARALGATGDLRSIHPLRDLLKQGNPGVVVAAIEGLRVLGDTDLGDLLNQALRHDDDEVVKQALYAIADARKPRADERIVIGLTHAAWDVRRLSAELLGELGGTHAVAALQEQRARESDDLVREAIEASLRKLVGG